VIGMRFQIQREGAVIREVIVEGRRLLLNSTERGPVNEGFASALNIDLDSYRRTTLPRAIRIALALIVEPHLSRKSATGSCGYHVCGIGSTHRRVIEATAQ
jgi:hypothetical protein